MWGSWGSNNQSNAGKGAKGSKGAGYGGYNNFGANFNPAPSGDHASIWKELLDEKRAKDKTKQEETLAHTVAKSVQDTMGSMMQALTGKSKAEPPSSSSTDNSWFAQTKQLKRLFAQPSDTSDDPGTSSLLSLLKSREKLKSKNKKKKSSAHGKKEKRKKHHSTSSSTSSSSASSTSVRKSKKKDKVKKGAKKKKKKEKAPSSEEKEDDRKRRKEVEIPQDNPKVAYAKLVTTLNESLPDTSFDVDTCDHDEWVKTVKNSTGVTINVLNKQLAKHSLSQTTHTDKSGKVNQLIDFYASN